MRLDWKEDGKSRIIAEYEAYSTSDGPAIATAVVTAQYGDWGFCDYETRVVDPYLKACGAGVYFTKIAYGSHIGDGAKEEAIASCEGYGVEQATQGAKEFDMRRAYEEALPCLAKRFISERYPDDPFDITFTDKRGLEVEAVIYEGGYEPARHRLIFSTDTLEFSDYVK